jgi:hypothetical protein
LKLSVGGDDECLMRIRGCTSSSVQSVPVSDARLKLSSLISTSSLSFRQSISSGGESIDSGDGTEVGDRSYGVLVTGLGFEDVLVGVGMAALVAE